MNITINRETKTITLSENVILDDFLKELRMSLDMKEWNEYTLITNVINYTGTYPVYPIYPTCPKTNPYPYPWDYPIVTY